MSKRRVDLIWGLVLVVLGGLFLGETMGWIPELTAVLWAGIFGVASVMFFVTFLVRGLDEWGWLFPAMATGAVAVIIALAEFGFDGPWLGSLMLWAVSLPFWVVFASNTKANWWTLIPGWVTAVIGFVVLLADRVPGEWIGALIMFAIALPFFVVYLRDRKQWWALIPGFVLSVVGVVVVLSTKAPEEMVGFIMVGAVSLPFFFVYFRSRDNWWALIPAGIIGSVALIALMSALTEGSDLFSGEPLLSQMQGGLLFLGWAATFGVLWLQRKQYPTGWAKYPAGVLLLMALVFGVLGPQSQTMWAVMLILAGVWLLVDNMRRPTLKSS